jgi:glutamate-1-semialdehyde aminotransferase
MVSFIFSNESFSNYREIPLRRQEAEMAYMLHRYLLNHGVQIIPHGMLILSTAMTEDDIDFMVDQAHDGMREIATTFKSGSSS